MALRCHGLGNHGWVETAKVKPTGKSAVQRVADIDETGGVSNLATIMKAEGVSPVLKVLYVPDYVPVAQRVTMVQELHVQLSQLIPGYEVHLALAPGPFEDDDGVEGHFEKDALGGRLQGAKQIAALK